MGSSGRAIKWSSARSTSARPSTPIRRRFAPLAAAGGNAATIDSGYAQLQGEVVPGLTLTAGERYDRHDVFGGHSTGALAAAWDLE